MVHANYKQRIRLEFGKGGPTRYISHLDLSRTLERSFNRSALPLAYTQGFNPRPRMQFADALPLGYTSSHEIADIWLMEPVELKDAQLTLKQKMAPGIRLNKLYEVNLSAPLLQTITQRATYLVEFLEPYSREEAFRDANTIRESTSIEIVRRGKTHDIRPLIHDITLVEMESQSIILKMILELGPGGTVRPDEVLKVIQIDPLSAKIQRTQIVLFDQARTE